VVDEVRDGNAVGTTGDLHTANASLLLSQIM
jgi:hypothetical protein